MTMMLDEKRFGVWLYEDRAGTLNHRGDYTWFTFDADYLTNLPRSVLGLVFEEDLHASHASAMRLPAWFANLLPEGRLREWIAADTGVSVKREMELLAHVGHDLPGAVRVLPEAEPPENFAEAVSRAQSSPQVEVEQAWRFSLAGVGLKFSMLHSDDRLSIPAHGQGGDWIVKMPDSEYADVPLNEHAMMTLAAQVGINVPEHVLVARDNLGDISDRAWLSDERWAYAVKRFDRGERGALTHIEDFAQVRDFYPDSKYLGSFETVGALCYRGFDLEALTEFVRRMTFNILISNGDAHLKNWSLIYRNPRVPTLSPAYDLVSTAMYAADPAAGEDLGLKLGKSRRFEVQRVSVFRRLGDRLGVDGSALEECAVETIDRVESAWPEVAETLDSAPRIRDAVSASVEQRRRSLLMSTRRE
jgi:serine/threonine-protein kinase HipA